MLQDSNRVNFGRFFYFQLLLLPLTFVCLTACQVSLTEPAYEIKIRDCRLAVHYRAPGKMDHVAVVGDFNDWDPAAHRLQDDDGDGDYFGLFDIEPGSYHYAIWVDGYIFRDIAQSLTHFDSDGVERSYVEVEDCSQPAWELLDLALDGQGNLQAQFEFLASYRGSELNADSLKLLLNNEIQDDLELEIDKGLVRVQVTGLPPGRYKVALAAHDSEGVASETWQSIAWVEARPFRWRDALIYQIVVDRFHNTEAPLQTDVPLSYYRGGTLDGVQEKIESGYFEKLGVNVLWLSPLNENADETYVGRDQYAAQAYHGYWPRSAREVETRFGAEQALEKLIQAAHARGIRVVMDYVLNHVHTDHPYFQNADWFNGVEDDCICGITCPWGENMLTCWFDPFLADLNWKNPEVVEQLTQDAFYWVDHFGLDGLRLDAIPMMPRLATRHLRSKLNKTIDRGKHHTYLLGETYTGSWGHAQIRHYLGQAGLSGQFEFPTMWTLRAALAGRESMQSLHAQVVRSAEAWRGSGAVMAPILGNHDVPRIISDFQGDPLWAPRTEPAPEIHQESAYALLKMAWTFILTQPGAPVIYYGDEFGMEGANDPDNRRNMKFGSALHPAEAKILEHVQALGSLRACSEVLRSAEVALEYVDDDLYIYKKAIEDKEAWIYLNRSDSQRLTTRHPALGTRLYAPLGEPVEKVGNAILIPPRTSLILTNHPTCLETSHEF